MVLRQCVNDFDVKKVIATIGGIGCTMIELDIVPQFYLKRTFCILETYATVVGKAKMLMTVNLVRAMRMREELQKEPVKAEESKCWSEEEERRIKGFIREQVEGGIKGFNKLVTAKMIEGADEVVRAARESSTLDLSNCELDSERGDGEVLAQIVSGFGALKTLNVASNPKLGFKGGAALASGLAGSGLISLKYAAGASHGTTGRLSNLASRVCSLSCPALQTISWAPTMMNSKTGGWQHQRCLLRLLRLSPRCRS
eukprot:5296492-Prymnesium_polylepis.1